MDIVNYEDTTLVYGVGNGARPWIAVANGHDLFRSALKNYTIVDYVLIDCEPLLDIETGLYNVLVACRIINRV